MSTVKNDKKGVPAKRFAQLAQMGEKIFHAKDLANIWNIPTPNTLHTTLKRYTQQRILYRIHRGFYSLQPISEISPLLLGIRALHRSAYVSTETVLAQHGIIFQHVPTTTLISDISKSFSIGSHHYRCRQLHDNFLYNSYGVTHQDGVRIATLSRAVADMLYFNPKAFFDAHSQIDWQEVQKVQQMIGYSLTPHQYDHTSRRRCHS